MTNSSITNLSLNHEIKQTISEGSHGWRISCFDLAENQKNSTSRTITITSPPAQSSGGGGGGSSTTKSVAYSPTIIETSTGYTKSLAEKDKILFSVYTPENGKQHSLTLNKIGSYFANITIESDPITILLVSGEEKKLNLSSSEYYDFYIKLEGIKNNKANITIKTVYEKIIKEQAKIPQPIQNETQNITSNDNKKTDATKDTFLQNLKTIAFVIIPLIIIIGIAVIIDRAFKKKEK